MRHLAFWGLLAVGLMPCWGGVSVVAAAPADSLRYRTPDPIVQVRRDADADGVPDRVGDTVSVAGRVAAAPGALPLPEEGVGALQDATGGIHVRLPEVQALSRGDSARVWGVLRHEAGLAQIDGLGYERVEAPGRVPAPVPLSVPSAASDRHEGRFARVSGTITARSANRGGEYFVLREKASSDAQLTVFVSSRHTDRIRLGRFDKGDRVEVTGVISQYDLSYQILPRGEDDLAHIGQAWTYLRWALLGVGGLGLVSIVAIVFLRSAVRRRTQELTRREVELKDRQMKVEALYSATDRLLRATSRAEVAEALIALVREVLGYRGVSVRFAEDGVLKVFDVAETTFTFMPERPDFDIDGDSAVAEVYRSGTTLAVDDVESVEAGDPGQYGDLRSVVGVPIGEHGTFAVASPEPGAISGFDTHLIEVLGSYATATLDRLDREGRLQEERDLLTRLLATSPAAIVLVNRDGEFIRANERAKEILGIEAEEMAAWTFEDPEWSITTVDGRPVPRDQLPFATVIETEEPVQGCERAIEWPDGTRHILSISGAPFQGGEGDTQGALFHLSDITEQYERERALREQKEKIEALYEATRQLLQAGSRAEVSARVHEVVRDVLGYPFGHTGFVEEGTIVPEETTVDGEIRPPRPEPRPVEGTTIAAQAIRAGEAVVVKRIAELNNNIEYGALRAAAGVPIGRQGALVVGKVEAGRFDQLSLRLLEVLGGYAALVLGRLGREKALRAAKEEAERARKGAEAARDQAEEAARLKSAFLANMSHEIRTPLTSIIGFAEALGEEVGDGNGNTGRFAGLIERSGRRLLNTLDGVLNLSKLEAGQMELETEPVDLVMKARQTAEEMRPQAVNKGLELTVEADRPEVWAQADPGALQIVLQNLVSNAIKYTEEGGAHIRVSRNQGGAELAVEDTGIGMDPARADDLFKPFRQASEGLGRVYEGSGVGLAVTQKATQKMGGQVEVATEEGAGSCFTVRLPGAESPDAGAVEGRTAGSADEV